MINCRQYLRKNIYNLLLAPLERILMYGFAVENNSLLALKLVKSTILDFDNLKTGKFTSSVANGSAFSIFSGADKT